MNRLFSEFKRKFSVSLYKNRKIKLGEMSFLKDFVNDTRGDLYPIVMKSTDCRENVADNRYAVTSGTVRRMFCQFFPFATYEVNYHSDNGAVGFCFQLPCGEAAVSVRGGRLLYTCGDHCESVSVPDFVKSEGVLIVSCRPGAFDIYFKHNEKPEYVHTFYEERFRDSNQYEVFSDGYVSLFAADDVLIKEVLSYIDNGVSIADIRPVKYENGDPVSEQGSVWLTASVRMQEGSFQGVFSWIPGTAEFQMSGVLFYDCGDGKWRNYVAPVIVYHRQKKQWYVWVSSFEGDPRFGVNVVDVRLMKKASSDSDITAFEGFKGDEDPDLLYDEENNRWLMAICRLEPETRQYAYLFFESDDPFDGYRYIGRGNDGSETGGSFIKMGEELFFVCGNDPKATSDYRIYGKNGMRQAKFNYPDGGFRGWGSIIPVKLGSRTRYFWLTFDRHNGSPYGWSYGNLYCFEAQ